MIAIRVEHLSKKYIIGAARTNYPTLRDALVATAKRLTPGRGKAPTHTPENEIWALDDISFEIQRGEVVGVIGRNGAGKSTLLKILAHITNPTRGRVEIHGRVGSLLEVGTGFHNELTGRENIYLNGAILGMKRAEIERKFDEIVAFSEIEKFLDTPVKHYSSGMFMRLAFAVAAHLEPEILLVDEVLAVGDAQFQKKCLGKMGEVAKEGRTVLFVSHNIPAIKSLCQIGLALNAGNLDFMGPIEQAADRYLAMNNEIDTGVVDLRATTHRFGSGELKIRKFWVEDETHQPVQALTSGGYCRFAIEYESMDRSKRRNVSMSIHINTLSGAPVSLINTQMLDQHFEVAPEVGRIHFVIQKLPLTAGRYIVDLNLATYSGYTYADFIKGAASFDVIDGDFYGTGRPGNTGAPVMIDGKWEIEPVYEKN